MEGRIESTPKLIEKAQKIGGISLKELSERSDISLSKLKEYANGNSFLYDHSEDLISIAESVGMGPVEFKEEDNPRKREGG